MSGSTGNDQDLYALLGVPSSASAAEIAAAYYLLARKYHPDTGGVDPESLARFKAISHAYEVLSDRAKRREYDRGRRRGAPSGTAQPVSAGEPKRNAKVPVATAVPSGDCSSASISPDLHVELTVVPEEARQGGLCDFILNLRQSCDRCAGGGSINAQPCPVCGGLGDVTARRRLQIRLPGGLRTGSVIRVAGHGGQRSGRCGDLWLHVRVRPYW